MSPQSGGLIGGTGDRDTYANVYSGLAGPTTFGGGYGVDADAGSGDAVGVYRFANPEALIAPFNYVSGRALTTSSTYNNATFATLGFTPGTYTYTWGAGGNADSLVITSDVPEPSTWAAVVLGAAGLGVVTSRRRRASVA